LKKYRFAVLLLLSCAGFRKKKKKKYPAKVVGDGSSDEENTRCFGWGRNGTAGGHFGGNDFRVGDFSVIELAP